MNLRQRETPAEAGALNIAVAKPNRINSSGDVGLLADKAEKLLGPLPNEAGTGLAMAAHVVAPVDYDLYRLVLAELERRQPAKRRARR